MWHKTWSVPNGVALISVEDVNEEEDLFIVSTKETRQTYGFRLSTGAQLWGPTPMRYYTDVWGHSSGNSWDLIADGKVIAGNYGGTVWCYDAQTGDTLWTFDIDDPYTEVLHNNRWRFRPVIVTDGKLYIENTEHNPRDPQPRGAPFICLDLESGTEIWRLPYRAGEWSTTAVIADSTIVIQNTYDQRIYAIGKGPSAITVTASPAISVHGSSVMLKGAVTDVSPGTEDATIRLRFPNGVPAVSDESMNEWMLYVYNQFGIPAAATGVTVTLETIDPNGNYQNLGTATTDTSGNYGFTFEPEVPGQYMIMATFYGSNGYYASTTTTYLAVDQAPSPATPIEPEPAAPEPTQPEPTQQYRAPTLTEPELTAETSLITTEVAILAAVAVACVIGIAAYWALKKRK
ncbi:hypothetical protein ES703_82182 [subsurface metagenome]